MSKKTKTESPKATPPGTTVNPAPTVSATPKPETGGTNVEVPPEFAEVNIGEVIKRNILGNPPVPVRPATEEAETHPPEEGATQSPETAAEPEAGQESSPAEGEAAGSQEEVAESEVAESDSAEPPEERDGRQKRIDKLTARNAALREELAEVQAQLQEQAAQQKPRAVESPVPAGHPELQAVDRTLAEQEEIIRWAENNLDGAEIIDSKGQTLSYDAVQVRKILAAALLKHARTAAVREVRAAEIDREIRSAFQRHHLEAAKQFPWMLKKESPEYQEAIEIVRKAPYLLHLPDHELLVGYMVEGKRTVAAKTKAAASKAPPKVVVAQRMPGLPQASPANTRTVVDPAAKALKRIQSGDERGVEDYFAAHLNGRAA